MITTYPRRNTRCPGAILGPGKRRPCHDTTDDAVLRDGDFTTRIVAGTGLCAACASAERDARDRRQRETHGSEHYAGRRRGAY